MFRVTSGDSGDSPVDAGVPRDDHAGLVGREERVRREQRPTRRADGIDALQAENKEGSDESRNKDD